MRVEECSKLYIGVMKVKTDLCAVDMGFGGSRGLPTHHGPIRMACHWVEIEHNGCDPKDGDLCLSRTKPEETLVEVRIGFDVQINR